MKIEPDDDGDEKKGKKGKKGKMKDGGGGGETKKNPSALEMARYFQDIARIRASSIESNYLSLVVEVLGMLDQSHTLEVVWSPDMRFTLKTTADFDKYASNYLAPELYSMMKKTFEYLRLRFRCDGMSKAGRCHITEILSDSAARTHFVQLMWANCSESSSINKARWLKDSTGDTIDACRKAALVFFSTWY